ncbi:DUF4178 domain-containing protein [Desulfospira joergensenii]|uniref:DUF4178 domain-containing protein n=1 Tax=Desulfospira joergensenii TaxID=53329 RepID=UPI0003B6D2C2|nr:DUF4178 domain-containing protein [Desulfospira joergensenii]
MLDPGVEKSFEERFSIVRTLSPAALVPEPEQMRLTLQDAGAQSFFTFMGKTYHVRDAARYEETSEDFKTREGYFLTELTCLCMETGETAHIEWEFDDELEIALTDERISFRHLSDEAGESIDGDDLDQIAEDKDAILYKGEKFWYEDDWAAIYQGRTREEKVYVYEFENEAQNRFLTIEEWQGSGKEEYQIYTSRPVAPDQIRILTRGEKS